MIRAALRRVGCFVPLCTVSVSFTSADCIVFVTLLAVCAR